VPTAQVAELTTTGNCFRIRHSETTQEALTTYSQVLFTRVFMFLRIVRKKTNRGG
jgi:hypothetical protein